MYVKRVAPWVVIGSGSSSANPTMGSRGGCGSALDTFSLARVGFQRDPSFSSMAPAGASCTQSANRLDAGWGRLW